MMRTTCPCPSLLIALLALALMLGLATAPAARSELAAQRLTDWSAPIVIATGRAERSRWQQNDSHYRYVDDPAVAMTSDGSTVVAWVMQTWRDVFVQRIAPDGSRTPTEPLNVSNTPATFSWLPRIATGPGREVHLLWQEIIFSGGSHGGDMLYARSTNGGTDFSPPINLSRSIAGDGKGRINRTFWHNGSFDIATSEIDGRSQVFVAWTDDEGRLWFTRSDDGGQRFAAPRRLAGSTAVPARAPSLAVRGDQLLLAWTVGGDDAADIRVVRSADGGEHFSPAVVVEPNASYSDAPKLAISEDGTVQLAFAESETGPFSRRHVRVARSEDGGKSFQPSVNVSGKLPAPYRGAGFPAIAIDRSGRISVLAHLFTGRQARAQALGMAISADGGRSFGPMTLIPGNAVLGDASLGSQQGLLMQKLAVHPDGRLAIVNSSFEAEVESRVWLQFGR